MKELVVELEQLWLLVVAVVGREQVGCASGSGATVDDKVGEDDERDTRPRESSHQPGRRLRGRKVTGRRETGRKESGVERQDIRRREGKKLEGKKWIEGKGSGGDNSERVRGQGDDS